MTVKTPRSKQQHGTKGSHSVKRGRAVAFVVARLSSTRLPSKQLRTIGGKPILQWILERLKECKTIDDIVIATVAEAANKPLRKFAEEHNVHYFWYEGEVDHVTTRLRRAAEAYQAEYCILISGDCPLICPKTVDRLVLTLQANPDADYCAFSPSTTGKTPHVEGVQVARRRTWELADDLSITPELKEHQFPIIKQRGDLFTKAYATPDQSLYAIPHRMSVDTLADLEFMNTVHDRLTELGKAFSITGVLWLLDKQPNLRKINAHVYQKKLTDKAKTVLFALDAGDQYGYGHLTRCVELASQIVERKGWKTTFLIDDERASEIISESGLHTIWGAWGRPPRNRTKTTAAPPLPQPDLLCLDIWPGRILPTGWRSKLASRTRVVVLDNTADWARESDLLVIPGVTASKTPEGFTNIVAGSDYIILRRDVRRAAMRKPDKNIDILVYTHIPEAKQSISNFFKSTDIKTHILTNFEKNFHDLLAASRIFISGFGYSFYEALALGAFPVTWPHSYRHKIDAEVFYRKMGITPVIISKKEDINMVTKVYSYTPRLPSISDGTSKIIDTFENLIKATQSNDTHSTQQKNGY